MQPRSNVLLGSAALLAVLVAGPVVSWHLFWWLWPMRWTLLCVTAAAEWLFYTLWYRPMYERFNRIPQPCEPPGYTPERVSVLTEAMYRCPTHACPAET